MATRAQQHHTIVALVEDKPGVLNRIASKWRQRGFNIESLAVGHSEIPGLSRMTFTVDGAMHDVEQVTKQLYKVIEVVKITDITGEDVVARELALIRVAASPNNRTAILEIAHDFRAMRADRGYFCFPEIDLGTGLPLTPGMYALLAARLSPATAHEALITGRRYDATEAVARQMVHEALREAEVLPRAIEIARGLASKDRATMAALKRGMFASALEALSQPVPEFLAAGRSVKGK